MLTRTQADARAIELAAVPWADELLDDRALSSRLRRPARATYVRMKPGRSLIIAWEALDDTGELGWAAVFDDPDKRDNALRRASRAGARLTLHEDGETALLSGPAWSDPTLVREISHARRSTAADAVWRVLRYNPRRRLIARVTDVRGDRVLRTAAHSGRRLRAVTAQWHALGAPVLPVEPIGSRGTTTASPWWGIGDLFSHPEPGAALAAGRAVARLHEQPVRGPAMSADAARLTAPIRLLAPWLETRLHRLAAQLQPRLDGTPGTGLLHGDLSPDQILVGTGMDREIRMVDLDRAGHGPAERDLGSWLASCRVHGMPELAQAFLQGYQGVRAFAESSVQAWEAHALLSTAAEPFRRREPEWPAVMEQRVALAEEAIRR